MKSLIMVASLVSAGAAFVTPFIWADGTTTNTITVEGECTGGHQITCKKEKKRVQGKGIAVSQNQMNKWRIQSELRQGNCEKARELVRLWKYRGMDSEIASVCGAPLTALPPQQPPSVPQPPSQALPANVAGEADSKPRPWQIRVSNECDKPIRVAVSYRQPSGNWVTRSWFNYAPGEEATLSNSYTRNMIVYYFAEGVESENRWEADTSDATGSVEEIAGQTYRFAKVKLEPDGDLMRMGFSCSRD